ncbi:hypothetical protein HPB48_020030 [Haemaphysalis longicornis]|uniref:ATP-dependent RNA helicase n=1 Tax=Haemaphysalis longicornis TaxID=44386 RepID=A0A9J6GLR7_HAELO|nr:hypothetical protein HPB48_020030 [Haemaphysalis longicornis]
MDDSDIVLNLNTDFQPRRKPFATPAAAAAATFHGGAPKKPPSVPVIRKPIALRTTPKTAGALRTALNKRNRDRQTDAPSDGDAEIRRNEQPTRKKAKNFVQASSLFDGRASLAEPEPVQQTTVVDAKNEPVFSSSQFADISVHPHLVSCLRDRFQITTATEVQKLAIPSLLMHRDTLIKSHTGSGKTLAYALPILHRLQEIRPKLTRTDGVRAVVIVPTRELALQTYEWFEKLSKACTWVVPGVLMGGEKRSPRRRGFARGSRSSSELPED